MIQLRITDFTLGAVARAAYAARCDHGGAEDDSNGGCGGRGKGDGAVPPPPTSDFSAPAGGMGTGDLLLYHGRPRVRPGGTILFDSSRSRDASVIPETAARLTGIRGALPLPGDELAARVGLVILVDGKAHMSREIPLSEILGSDGQWTNLDVPLLPGAGVRLVLNDPDGLWPAGTGFTLWARATP